MERLALTIIFAETSRSTCSLFSWSRHLWCLCVASLDLFSSVFYSSYKYISSYKIAQGSYIVISKAESFGTLSILSFVYNMINIVGSATKLPVYSLVTGNKVWNIKGNHQSKLSLLINNNVNLSRVSRATG